MNFRPLGVLDRGVLGGFAEIIIPGLNLRKFGELKFPALSIRLIARNPGDSRLNPPPEN